MTLLPQVPCITFVDITTLDTGTVVEDYVKIVRAGGNKHCYSELGRWVSPLQI